MRRRHVLTGTALAVTLACASACGGSGRLDTSAPATRTTPSPASSSPSASATQPATPSATPAPSSPTPKKYAVVDAGRWAKDPAVATFAAAIDARTHALATRDAGLPPFTKAVSSRYLTYQKSIIDTFKRNGWTIAVPQRYVVVAVSRTGGSARLRVCENRNSPLVAKTGKPAQKPTGPNPLDVRMSSTHQGWRIDYVYDATFSCKGTFS